MLLIISGYTIGKKIIGKQHGKEPVKNRELWEELYSLTKEHDVSFIKVKGHSTNELNNRCDELARKEIESYR